MHIRYIVFVSIGMVLYDIFMVHITPLFNPSKKSIMVEVATQPQKGGTVRRYALNM